ncbi:MAG TPA: hypothetical protein VFL62_02575 [Bradyrhizobium sp.]|uniref:hypothetical protein n=1 Tax=Bradyrhizobium sp. TaxID=376 RepID=UPI002D7FB2FD|nr:hypothetical protein [Bradyrhizobium sp.]HET7885090.1 hypothetical protein [Bradyrhizobium sp.]
MRYVRDIALAGCLLALASPAMAAGAYNVQGAYRATHGPAVVHRMRAQDFDHFDLGIARPRYHSGWGGPYGDGDYPGTVDQNMGPPYWGH